MKYQIELAATAKADIREAAEWLRDQASPSVADRWLFGLYKAMDTLQIQPQRCPLAAESHKFPEEIRELLYGRRKSGKHRILFTIKNAEIYILYVRHTARDEIEP